MSDITGTVHHQFAGREYELRLTLGGVSKLQAKHGLDVGGMLSADGANDHKIPDFGIMIDIVAIALEKGGSCADVDQWDLADDMLTGDKSLAARILQAAFPEARAGGGGAAGKRVAPKAKA